jgi:hypothetical protein
MNVWFDFINWLLITIFDLKSKIFIFKSNLLILASNPIFHIFFKILDTLCAAQIEQPVLDTNAGKWLS